MARVFISYTTRVERDQLFAREITKALDPDHKVFNFEKMPAGTDWIDATTAELESADVVIFLVSRTSLKSRNVLNEIRMAQRIKDKNKRLKIIPVILDPDIDLGLEFIHLDTIRQVQFDGKPDQAFIQKILHSINTEEDNLSVGATPKPPVPAGRPIESISETEFHIRNFDEKLRVIVGGDDSVSNVTKIKGYVDAVRAALDQLCSRFVDNRPEDRDGGLDELRELAKAGEQLKDRLFEGPARASEVESLLAAPNGRRQCWFQLDHKTPVQIPWGLLFDRPPKHGRKLEPEELKRGFWCMKYDVCTLVSRSSRSSRPGIHSLEEPLHVTLTPSEILGVFNDAAVAHASDRGPQGWPKDSICYSTATLYDKARSIENILLYFFCNAKGDTLYLGSNSPAEVLKPSTFKQLMTQTKGQPRAFLFLNGCPTSGTAQAEWLSINGNVKFSGIIATEARVPTRFAWNFGRDLLRQFGDGKTAADALRDLRTLHWPLGLAYSLYSHTKRAAITLTGLKFPAPTAENFGALQNCPSYTLQK